MKYIITLFSLILFSFGLRSQCASGYSAIKIVLTTDNYASETSWQLKNSLGTVYMTNATLTNATTFTSIACVPQNECINFVINDSYGDGICCSYGTGSFQIYINGVLQVNHNGQFGSSTSLYFNCPPGTSCNSALTANTGTYTAPGSEYFYSFKPTQKGLYSITTCSLTNSCDTK